MGLLAAVTAAVVLGLAGSARAGADLAVAVSDTSDPVSVGRSVSYTIGVRNAGPSSSKGVTVTVTVPADLDLEEVRGRACSPRARTVVCKLGSLRSGVRAIVRLVGTPTSTGSVSIGARVSAKTRDPRRNNNSATQSTRVIGLDTVRGQGVRPVFGAPGSVSIEIDASSAFDGSDAAGTFATHYPGGDPDLRGRVVCLAVSGNRAMVGGVVESAGGSNPGATPPGSGVLFAITDNGGPGAGRDTELTFLVLSSQGCGVQDAIPEIPLSSGDFTVHDESP